MRIPKPDDLPQASIGVTRRIYDVPVDRSGEGMANFASAAGEVAGRIRDNQIRTALAEADLDARRELSAIETAFDGDKDWETIPQRGREAAQKALAERGKTLRDGAARRVWEQRSAAALGDFETRLAGLSRRRGADIATADVIRLGEKARQMAVDPTVKPEDRDMADRTFRDRVAGARDTGLFGEAQATELLTRHDAALRTERGQIAAQTFTARIDQIAGTLATAPGRFDELVGAAVADIQADPNLPEPEKVRLVNVARQGAAVSTVQALIDQRPGETLRMLRDEKAGGPFAALGDRRPALINAAQAEVQRREVEFKSNVREQFAAHIEAYKMGLPVEKRLNVATVRAALGDAQADLYEMLSSAAVQTEGLSTRPSAEVFRLANQPDPENATPAAMKAIAAQRRAAATVLEQREKDPAAFAIRRGLVPEGGLSQAIVGAASAESGAALATSIDQIAAGLRTRRAQIESAAQTLGMPARPLTTDEAALLGRTLDSLPASARADALLRFNRAMGGGTSFMQMVSQLRPDSPVTALAGALTTRQRPVGDISGIDAAQLLLQGEDLLNPTKASKSADGKPAKVAIPGDADLRAQWSRRVGDAFRGAPDAEALAYQGYRAAYAALAVREGRVDGVIDADLAKKAAAIATGGTTKWAGSTMILPWGMDRATFEDSLRRGWPDITAQAPLLRGTNPRNVRMRAVGDGLYLLESVERADGSPLLVRVDPTVAAPQRPAAPAPTAPTAPRQRTGADE